MASNHTQHFALNRWDLEDQIIMDDFNEDNEKIDAALKANADAVINLRADLSRNGKLTRFAYGSYVGAGDSGPNAPNVLTFDFYPALVLVSADNSHCCMIRGMTTAETIQAQTVNVSWTDNGVSWYYLGNGSRPNYQLNSEGVTYHYVAFGEAR